MSDETFSSAVLQLFEETGAYLHGHFQLTSGLHSPEYLQCALVLQHPRVAERLGQMLARECERLAPEMKIDLVVAPALGGLIIGHEVARAMNVPFLFTERDADRKMSLRRGFQVSSGQKAVVIEDVVTTGGSSREVVELLQAAGVDVIGAGSIIDRSNGAAELGVPRKALATLQATTYPPEQCPLCQEGVPVRKPGSRPSAKA